MFIEEMTEAECLTTLARTRLGRLACAHKNKPYVVPIYFVYEKFYLYGFTTPGQKVEWMRSNPLVCVELDEIFDDTHVPLERKTAEEELATKQLAIANL